MDCTIGRPGIEGAVRQPILGAIQVATWRPSRWNEGNRSGFWGGWGSLWSKATRRLTEEASLLGAVVVWWRGDFCDQPERGTRTSASYPGSGRGFCGR